MTIVGAPFSNSVEIQSGSAYVFVRNLNTWPEQAKLTASDAAAYDNFGSSVAISGDVAIVGAPYADTSGTFSGSAYVFVRNLDTWEEQAILTASDAAAGDKFGSSVAISGDVVIVGVPDDDDAGSRSGSAYVFERNGNTWEEQAKLTASDAVTRNEFGSSVAISGDVAIVGMDYRYSSGHAYVFVRNGNTWEEQAKLTASDAAEGDYFGRSVAISGDVAIVGAEYNSDAGFASGSAYIYENLP